MKTTFTLGLVSALAMAAAQGKGLYYVPNDTEESLPIRWSVGIDAIYDDNTNPGGLTDGDETFSVNPYVGMSFVSVTPQTTWDVYARLGVIYYLDAPAAPGSDDVFGQARAGVNLTHNFNERLRFSSRNFLAYELEPDYSYGFATNRQVGEYFYWQTDNSLGYRWTERFATISGISLTGLDYDSAVPNADRFTWTVYNQGRYQVSSQTVLTASYRYSETTGNGVATDSTNQYLLVGLEHRFTPNTIAIVNVGAQIRDVDGINGDSNTNPYAEVNLRTQVNTQFAVRTFLRYGVEDYDTVFAGPALTNIQYDERLTLRVGVSGTYEVSQSLSLYGGVDFISTSFDSGRDLATGAAAVSADETLVNAYIGASLKLTEILTGSLTYNFTDSNSDLLGRDYDRNRITVGLSAEF